jgi:hypothetical protein
MCVSSRSGLALPARANLTLTFARDRREVAHELLESGASLLGLDLPLEATHEDGGEGEPFALGDPLAAASCAFTTEMLIFFASIRSR